MISIDKSLLTDRLMKNDFFREKVLKALKKGKFSAIGAFGIFLPQNRSNLYEIIRLNELRKKPYRDGSYHMIGLAGSRYEAIMMAGRLWLRHNRKVG